VSVEGEQVFLC